MSADRFVQGHATTGTLHSSTWRRTASSRVSPAVNVRRTKCCMMGAALTWICAWTSELVLHDGSCIDPDLRDDEWANGEWWHQHRPQFLENGWVVSRMADQLQTDMFDGLSPFTHHQCGLSDDNDPQFVIVAFWDFSWWCSGKDQMCRMSYQGHHKDCHSWCFLIWPDGVHNSYISRTPQWLTECHMKDTTLIATLGLARWGRVM